MLDRVYALWEDDGYIRMLGLASDGHRTAEQLREQREVCDVVFKGTLSLSKNFYLLDLEHTVGLPLLFAKLLWPDGEKRSEASMSATIRHN